MTEEELRAKIFIWLDNRKKQNGGIFTRNELLKECLINGKVITLVGATGIWIPKNFTMPISITTTSSNPYDDQISADGFLKYKYRGTQSDTNHRDNQGLRKAYITKTPLIYFHSIKPGKYFAIYPIYIMEDNPNQLFVKAEIDPISIMNGENFMKEKIMSHSFESNEIMRKYTSVLTKKRLHQATFREFVLDAYNRQCTLCGLRHKELLDAAHIIEDSEPEGEPVINNGLSLCKIHHAAFDQRIIGISPEYKVKVRTDILEEIDGPMLQFGLQSLEGSSLNLPSKKFNFPDRERLEIKYNQFLEFM